jgi:hypothetical protein
LRLFTNEFVMAFLKELPGVLEIAVRYWLELATHAIGILSKML